MGTIRLFKHHVHAAFLWLAVTEAFLLGLSVYVGAYLRFSGDASVVQESIGDILPRALVFGLATVICMAAMGLYQPRAREGGSGVLLRMAGAFLLTGLALSVIFYLFPDMFLGRGALGLTVLTAFAVVLLVRMVFWALVGEDRLKKRVLVFGSGHRASKVKQRLRRETDRRGFKFVGFVNISGEVDVVDANQVVRLDGSICDYVRENQVDEILVAMDDRRKGLPIGDLLECKLSGVDVLDVVTFFERETGRIMLEFVTPGWMIFSDGFNCSSWRAVSKRGFDLVASFVLLMMTWPIMLIAVLAIWIEDGFGTPVVYRQQRVGLNGRGFFVLKFRSMRPDAEKDGKAVWAQKNDQRVTRVGRFIRACRIDELPQIINVLAGDMGFVGPRPERPQFVDQLNTRIPHYGARHQVKPGIAGWAQLCYPYGASEEDAQQKLQFDLYYVKNHSLFLDFLILVQTVEIVLFGKGAR